MRSREDRACMAAKGRGGGLKPGQAAVLLPPKEGETHESPVAYRAPLRQALIDDNNGHVNVVVCEADYWGAQARHRSLGAAAPVKKLSLLNSQ